MGFGFWLGSIHNSALYAGLLLLWQTIFVEYWRIRERVLSFRWATAGSARVEPPRYQYKADEGWWKSELRYIISVSIVAFFATLLAAVISSVFLLEGFVAHMYTGPFHQFAVLGATATIAVVPVSLAIYRMFIVGKLVEWENHRSQSGFERSLVRKTFAVNAIVAYWMLALSAFVYNPFGEQIMHNVHAAVDYVLFNANITVTDGISSAVEGNSTSSIWAPNALAACERLNSGRTRDQLFAYTVTNQGLTTFAAVAAPYVIAIALGVMSKRSKQQIQKREEDSAVEKPTEKLIDKLVGTNNDEEERIFLETIRGEVAKPELNMFNDYLEMITQFG